MERLKAFFKNIPNGKILDVGTGNGNFIDLIDHLDQDYQEIVGIDIIERVVQNASKYFEQNNKIKIEKRDILETGYEVESFDMVCLSNSLHHLEDIKTTFLAMEALVKPGGYLLINEMMKDNLTDQQISHKLLHHFSAKLDREIGYTHHDTYNRSEILKVIREHSTFLVVDYWDMIVPKETMTIEEVEGFANTVDFLINRLPKEKQEGHLLEGEHIKQYIIENGVQSCTQLLVILKKTAK